MRRWLGWGERLISKLSPEFYHLYCVAGIHNSCLLQSLNAAANSAPTSRRS